MATWPSTLPAPLLAGYGINPTDMTVRTEMEVGPARVRRRSSARVDMVPVQIGLSDVQMSAFRDWFDAPEGANGGAAWFDIDLLMGNGGFQSVQARFAGVWQSSYVPHKRWNVTATLEVRDA